MERLQASRLVSYLKVDCNVKQKGRRFFIPWQRWERDIDFSTRNQTRQVDGLLRLDLGILVARLQLVSAHTVVYTFRLQTKSVSVYVTTIVDSIPPAN